MTEVVYDQMLSCSNFTVHFEGFCTKEVSNEIIVWNCFDLWCLLKWGVEEEGEWRMFWNRICDACQLSHVVMYPNMYTRSVMFCIKKPNNFTFGTEFGHLWLFTSFTVCTNPRSCDTRTHTVQYISLTRPRGCDTRTHNSIIRMFLHLPSHTLENVTFAAHPHYPDTGPHAGLACGVAVTVWCVIVGQLRLLYLQSTLILQSTCNMCKGFREVHVLPHLQVCLSVNSYVHIM